MTNLTITPTTPAPRAGTRRAVRLTVALAALCLALATAGVGTAGAALGDLGFADINQSGNPSVPTAPAFFGTTPGTKAFWAGACDLSSASTVGGVGALNGGVEPPALRGHCISMGADSRAGTGDDDAATHTPWLPGIEPAWRLSPVIAVGAHPDATASFWFNHGLGTTSQVEGSIKNIIAKLPPGVVGNPEAVGKCSALEAQALPTYCPAQSQVGIATNSFPSRVCELLSQICHLQTQPVYATEARDTVTAEFMITNIALWFNTPITARGRTNSDYGVDTLALLIPDFVPIGGSTVTFWGVPWASSHDKFRTEGACLTSACGLGSWIPQDVLFKGISAQAERPYQPNWGPIKPFFTNPTECSGEPLPVTLEVDSWQKPASLGNPFLSETTLTDVLDGCNQIQFDPSMTLRPTADVADSPSGLDVKLSIPQNNDPPENVAHDPNDSTGAPNYWKTPAGRATAHLKDTTVHLPAGTSFNPAAANGLRGCTTAQIGLTATEPKVTFNNDPVQCPPTSKIGTLKIVSPLLPDPLLGDVYAAPQNDNPFPGSLTAIYLVAQDNERGLSVKLAGKVDLDPDTGQIATTFVDNPQLPFNEFELHFKTGPRAPLNTPATCGNFENAVDLIPWSFPGSGPQPTIHDPFPISAMPNGLGCVTEPEDRVFKPGFDAGSTSTAAAAHTDFVLNVSRRDGEQEISGISLDMAPGVTGDLSKTPYCPEAAIAAARTKTGLEETNNSSCPAASYIGKVDTLAGAGTLPLPTTGKLYLSGPYDADGAGPKPQSPLSVTTVVPAIAGGAPGNPAFDLGNVVIRTGVNLDPQTAQVHIDSTDVPYIVGGIPLRIRNVAVTLDKPNFMLNPTNCEELKVGGSIRGAADPLDKTDDIFSAVSSRFQVDGCKDMGFKPNLTIKLKGGTKRADYPAFTATLTPRAGDANLKSISVALPHSEFLAQNHINTVCTRAQFAAKECPEGSIYGFAKAWTPLLKDPLEGPVILKSSTNPLPDLVLDLHGQVDLAVVGRIDSVNGGLRNTFEVTPDAPVTKFVLEMKGGKKGLLENSRDVCARSKIVKKVVNGKVKKVRKKIPIAKANADYTAQNGIVLNQKIPVTAEGCGKAKKAKRHSKG